MVLRDMVRIQRLLHFFGCTVDETAVCSNDGVFNVKCLVRGRAYNCTVWIPSRLL